MHHCIEKNRAIVPLEMNDKCMSDQNPTSQKGACSNWTIEDRPSPPKKIGKWFENKPNDPL